MNDYRPSNRLGGFGSSHRRFGSDRSRSQMHDATCDNCGKHCQVPFRPSGDKPVYCDDCFSQQPGREPRRRDHFRSVRPDSGVRRFDNSSRDLNDIKKQLHDLSTQVDKILTILGAPLPKNSPPLAETESDDPEIDAVVDGLEPEPTKTES